MNMEVYKEFVFDAAHRLPNVPKGHKCGEIHGHTFKVIIYVEGKVDPDTGWVIDFAEIKCAFQPFLQQLDHTLINNIEGLQNPTSENLAKWIWTKTKPALPGLSRIIVQENPTCGAIYYGDEDEP